MNNNSEELTEDERYVLARDEQFIGAKALRIIDSQARALQQERDMRAMEADLLAQARAELDALRARVARATTMMTEQIEQLTEEERRWLLTDGARPPMVCAKALRLLDAHAADRAALVAELAQTRKAAITNAELVDEFESEVARLREELAAEKAHSADTAAAYAAKSEALILAEARVEDLTARASELEEGVRLNEQLAVANALLGRIPDCLLTDCPVHADLMAYKRAHLSSAQPALPDYDPITAPIAAGDWNGPHGALPAAPDRTNRVVSTDHGVTVTAFELTPEERAGLCTGGARLPPTPERSAADDQAADRAALVARLEAAEQRVGQYEKLCQSKDVLIATRESEVAALHAEVERLRARDAEWVERVKDHLAAANALLGRHLLKSPLTDLRLDDDTRAHLDSAQPAAPKKDGELAAPARHKEPRECGSCGCKTYGQAMLCCTKPVDVNDRVRAHLDSAQPVVSTRPECVSDQLRELNPRVVTADEQRVLDACAKARLFNKEGEPVICVRSWNVVWDAELARRKA